MLCVGVQREDAMREQSPSLFPSAHSGSAARLTQRQEVSPSEGRAAGQSSVNHQSKINTSDDLVGKGGNETPAFERSFLRRDLSGHSWQCTELGINPVEVCPLLLCTHIVGSVLLSKDPRAAVGSGSASFPGQEKDDLQVTMQQNSRKKNTPPTQGNNWPLALGCLYTDASWLLSVQLLWIHGKHQPRPGAGSKVQELNDAFDSSLTCGAGWSSNNQIRGGLPFYISQGKRHHGGSFLKIECVKPGPEYLTSLSRHTGEQQAPALQAELLHKSLGWQGCTDISVSRARSCSWWHRQHCLADISLHVD